jgi:hypothetical protein
MCNKLWLIGTMQRSLFPKLEESWNGPFTEKEKQTIASLHDSQVAIPLMKISTSRVIYFYDVMDSAYCTA